MDIKDFDRRLLRHDWYFRESDDIKVYRRGKADEEENERLAKLSPQHQELYAAYVGKRGMPDNALRIRTGATTQAELDAIAEQERQEELEQEQRRLQQLKDYNRLCGEHDWTYWKGHANSVGYQKGLEKRTALTKRVNWYDPADPYQRLFRAWAKFYQQHRSQAALKELYALREELQIAE